MHHIETLGGLYDFGVTDVDNPRGAFIQHVADQAFGEGRVVLRDLGA